MTVTSKVARLVEGAEGRLVVACPACEEKYTLRSMKVLQLGGSFLCKVCRARVFLPGIMPMAGEPAACADPLSSTVATAGTLPAQSGETAVAGEVFPEAAAPGSPRGAEILCPHCHMTFLPSERGAALAGERMPASPGTRAAASPAAGAGPAGAAVRASGRGDPRPTILVVEDTEFFLQLASDALSRHYTAVTARTSSEALALLADGPIDAVILDLTLQNEEDGLEVLAAASSKGIPSLIFTARNDAELWGKGWERLQQLGARDLLIKGMNVEDQILDKVAELLRS